MTGLVRAKFVAEQLRVSRIQAVDRLARVRKKRCARKLCLIQAHAHEVRERVGDVGDRDEERERVALPHRRRRRERHVEERISDDDSAPRCARDRNRANRKSVQNAADIEIDLVKSLAASFQQELRLALLTGLERARVVPGARLAIVAHAAHWKHEDLTAGLRLGNDQRVVRRRRNLVIPEGQLDARFEVSNGKTGTGWSAVRDEQQRAKELIQETDIAGNDNQPRDLNIRKKREELLLALRRQARGQHHGHDAHVAQGGADDADARVRGFCRYRNLVRVKNYREVDRHRPAVEL